METTTNNTTAANPDLTKVQIDNSANQSDVTLA